MATLVRALSKKTVGLKQLSKIFQQQGGLEATKLDLTEQKIGDDGLKHLFVLLNDKKNNKLKEIIFYGNDLTDNSIEILADLLTTHYRISHVRLDYNDISPVGAKKIADFLKTNETLHKLDLYGNKIKDQGAEQIAKALDKNTNLQVLGLFGCGITNKGATSLVRHLEKNTTIKQMNVENNEFDDDLQEAIAAFVARNNKQEFEVPDSIYEYYKTYPEDSSSLDVPSSLLVGTTPSTPVKKNQEEREAEVVEENILASSLAINLQESKQRDESLLAQIAKAADDKEWVREKKDLYEKVQILIKDKEALAKQVAQLHNQIVNLQKKNAHLESFLFTVQKGFAALSKEHPLPE